MLFFISWKLSLDAVFKKKTNQITIKELIWF